MNASGGHRAATGTIATEPTIDGWRARWAAREDDRRQRAYDSAVEQWRRRDDELRQMRAQAVEATGPVAGTAGLPITLETDEIVHDVQPGARLVEATARHAARLPRPDLCPPPVPTAPLTGRRPRGIVVRDVGLAVVTDRRVVFAGRQGEREWTYPRLAGLAHHPGSSLTLLPVWHRRRLAGLLLSPAVADRFRFTLNLAYAEATGRRTALVAQLDELIAAHQKDRPDPPAAAEPDEAPVTGVLSPSALAVVAAAAAVALLVLVGVLALRPDPAPRSPTRVADPATSTTAPAPAGDTTAPVVATPTAATAPTVTAEPAAAVFARPGGPVRPHPTGRPPTGAPPTPGPTVTPSLTPSVTATPSPTPSDRCGAPVNPYGYTYCAGGTLIPTPAPDVCSYFSCVAGFWNGNGYLIQCQDDQVSLTGGLTNPCAGHGGARRNVYQS